MESKVSTWMANIKLLSDVAKTQPHATFSGLTHGLQSKWVYLSHTRTVPNIAHLLEPLDDVLRSGLLPAITGRPPTCDLEYALFALPAQLGGLGISFLSKKADCEYQSSILVSAPLKDRILLQDKDYSHDILAELLDCKAMVKRQTEQRNKDAADKLHNLLSDSLQRAVDLVKETGAYTWLTVLPPDCAWLCLT